MKASKAVQAIRTAAAPAAIGPYEQGRVITGAGRWIVTSGQLGLHPDEGRLVEGGVAAETERSLRNIEAVLASAGATLADVVKTTVFLIDMDDFKVMNEVYSRFFPDTKPARSTVAVSALPLNGRVEIEVWAFLP